MTKIPCPVCTKLFEAKTTGRAKLFCSRACFRKDYRQRIPIPSTVGQNCMCDICGKPFVKAKSHQRYCSTDCYEGAWVENNRPAHNARVRKRRKEKPEWYREREPKYYRTHRSSVILARPWNYALLSRRMEAKTRKWEYDLTHEWAAARWTGKCEITGVPFRLNPAGRGPYPFSCTIDCIDPSRGYTQDNSRFILWGCNALKGSGTDTDMLEIAQAIVMAAHKC